jgi:hypothetical protein
VTLTAKILLQILATESSSSDLSSTTRVTNVSRTINFANGVGANQAEIVWSDSRTIATNGEDILDLTALADDRGSVDLTAVKAIYVRNTGTVAIPWLALGLADHWATGPLYVEEGFGVIIPPGGVMLITSPSATGWAVASGGEQISFANDSSTTAATYDIILIGEGAIGS